MSQQEPDLPRFVQIIGRYKALVGIMAAVGLLAGIVFAALNSPLFTSQALVVVSPTCPSGAICGGPAFSPGYKQAGLPAALPGGVQVNHVAGDVLSVSAVARTPARAEAAANAAARSYLAYVGSQNDLGGPPSTQIRDLATTATGTAPPKRLLIGALLGAVFGALLGVIAALAGSRTTTDPLAAPRGFDDLEGDWGARQRTNYPPTGLSLEELAQEYSGPRADRYSPFDWSGTGLP
jgi:hypothetical protein